MRRGRYALVVCALLITAIASADASAATIDRVRTAPFGGYTQTYSPGTGAFSGLMVLAPSDFYDLSDGTSWESGAGGFSTFYARPSSVNVDGGTVRYTLDLAPGSVIYNNTDYDSGDHSSQGSLTSTAPLVLTAQAGSQTATFSGVARVASNDMTWYGLPRFNFYTAPVGSYVPFDATYTLRTGTWGPDTFASQFTYDLRGVVNFADFTLPEPACAGLLVCCATVFMRRRFRQS